MLKAKMNKKMKTYTNLEFDPDSPQANQINLEDILVALSRLPRFVGQTNRLFTVLEHSLLCYYLALDLQEPSLSSSTLLHVLLHDSAEAYTGDIPTPVKDLLRPKIDEVEEKILLSIKSYFKVPLITEKEKQIVKLVDSYAFSVENEMFKNGISLKDLDITCPKDSLQRLLDRTAKDLKMDFTKILTRLMEELDVTQQTSA